MLGVLYIGSGNEGARVLDNYKLLFAILMHCSMATMMLTVLTCMYNKMNTRYFDQFPRSLLSGLNHLYIYSFFVPFSLFVCVCLLSKCRNKCDFIGCFCCFLFYKFTCYEETKEEWKMLKSIH